MKKTYRFTDDEFQKILREAVSKVVKRSLNEDFDDFDAHDTDDSDDYEDELLKSMDRSNRKALGIDDKQSSGDFFRDVRSLGSKNGSTSQKGGDVDFDDEIWGKESTDDFESETEENGLENNELYVKALEDLENDNGRTKMNAWVDERVEEGSDEDEAIKAFEAAKAEYDKESEEFTTDTVNDFNDREEEVIEPAPVHQAGNVINYEGVEIRDNGNQYVMVANEQNPNITIKGSDLKEVEQTYDSLWRDISKMEDKARKMGMTVYHDALLWADDYDKFVRAYGGHEENLPVIIDLDKMKNRYGKTSGQPSVSQSKSNSWLEPYKHEINSKYMMTPYQLSRLSPEQRSQWENFSKRYPGQYVTYSEAPSLAKINRSKRQ